MIRVRNNLLALFCLLVFVALGVVFFRSWVVQKPFGIILFLGDGLTLHELTAARLFEEGAGHRLAMERFPHAAILSNHAADFAAPDSAAASSAIATGVKVNNRALSVDPNGRLLASLMALARKQKRATGFVTNGNLTDAGAAAFYAQITNCSEVENIAAQFLEKGDFNVALGGGAAHFLAESKGGIRKDGRDLALELRQKGYDVIRSKAELESTPTFRTANIVGLFNNGPLAGSNSVESGNQHPSLSDMVRRAIEFLQYNTRGYLLVVDEELVTRAASKNDSEQALRGLADFNHAIGTALKYAGEKTLVLVVGKKSTGGLTLNGYPLRSDRGVSLLGTNTFGYPSITWSTGPNGPNPATSGSNPPPSAPAAFHTNEAVDIASDVIAAGSGPGSEALNGFMDNTQIFGIVRDNL